jgi:hypothetical protein
LSPPRLDPAADIAASPELFPIQAEGERGRLIRLDEDAYRQASFLDERLLAPGEAGDWRPWAELDRAAAALAVRCDWIFHIGHVGSTLMARLLGEHPALFCLREPALLRPVAAGWPSPLARARLATLLPLLSRTWRPGQTALVKATSFVSGLAADLLDRDPQARAVLMAVGPPSYLRGILGGEASRQELPVTAPLRLARLQRRLGAEVRADGEGALIAASWLCETLALHDAAGRHGERTLWIDFDRFLAAPEAGLAQALAHLRAPAEPAFVRELAQGPLMRRYSKGPEHAYDAGLRRRVQAQAEALHGAEVRAGMNWLQAVAAAHPPVMEVLRRAAVAARPVASPPPGR